MKKVRIEVPKRVVSLRLADGRLPTAKGIVLERYVEIILTLQEMIENGEHIPEFYYRRSRGRDDLLEKLGFLHLHVGRGLATANANDDDVLLIVEQTDEAVIFIGLFDHGIFEEKPLGKSMFGLRSKVAAAKLGAKPSKTGQKARGTRREDPGSRQ